MHTAYFIAYQREYGGAFTQMINTILFSHLKSGGWI